MIHLSSQGLRQHWLRRQPGHLPIQGLFIGCLLVLVMMITSAAASAGLLFEDGFDNGMENWNVIAGSWEVKDGQIWQTDRAVVGAAVAGEYDWRDYRVTVTFTLTETSGPGSKIGFGVRYQNPVRSYNVGFSDNGFVGIYYIDPDTGAWVTLIEKPGGWKPSFGTPVTAEIVVEDTLLQVLVEGQSVIEVFEPEELFDVGAINLWTVFVAGSFDDVRVEAVN